MDEGGRSSGPRDHRTMRCSLCRQPIDLFELDEWQGEPVHTWCKAGADEAWDAAFAAVKAKRAAQHPSAA